MGWMDIIGQPRSSKSTYGANNKGDLQCSYLTKLILLHLHGKQRAAFFTFSP